MAWYGESRRHALAAKGIKTGHRFRSRQHMTVRNMPKERVRDDEITLDLFKGKNIEYNPDKYGTFEGNFNAEFAEALYNAASEGWLNDQAGEASTVGWYGLIYLDDLNITEDGTPVAGAILHEDNYGSFSYFTYPTKAELLKDWKKVENLMDEYYSEHSDEYF